MYDNILFFTQECSKHDKIEEIKKSEGTPDSAESHPDLWKWSGKLDELTNRYASCHASLLQPVHS